uniref:Sugar transporter SWEET n=1 Tax=Parascaris equorum TaxID=6256 RepID=A0A914RGS3_PAREQ
MELSLLRDLVVCRGSCWWAYGYLKKDQTVLYVTSVQVVLYSSYLVFYWIMTKKKLMITLKVAAVVAICSGLYLMVHCFGMKKYVIRKRSSQTLPLPLCVANFLVSNEWFIYGLLKDDFYLTLPNGVGAVFATISLVLFVMLPRKTGLRSPLLMLVDLILCRSHHNVENIEAGIGCIRRIERCRRQEDMVGQNDRECHWRIRERPHKVCHKRPQLCRRLSSKLEPQQKVPVLKRAASAPNLTSRREEERGTTDL